MKASWSGGDKAPVLTLTTDKPALFVTATVDVPGYFSDNAVTLLPGRETRLAFTPRLGAKVTQKALAAGLKVLRAGVRPDGSKVSVTMPWQALSELTDDELQGLYLYLKTLAPKGQMAKAGAGA